MPRKRNPIPTYRLHKRTGRAIVCVRDHAGARREILLPGAYGSDESRAEYDSVCALLRATKGTLPPPAGCAADLNVAELILQFMDRHASAYYLEPETRTPTRELECLALAFRPLKRLYGSLRVIDFKPAHLEALQEAMATGSWQT